jgi:hypothetical protein
MTTIVQLIRSCSVRRASFLFFAIFANLSCLSYKPQFILPFQTRLCSNENDLPLSIHRVNDFLCNEVKVVFDYKNVPYITILEADADAQEQLINIALEEKSTEADEDPYGSVLWPSAKTCSLRLLELNLDGKSVLELGTGTRILRLISCLFMCMISELSEYILSNCHHLNFIIQKNFM